MHRDMRKDVLAALEYKLATVYPKKKSLMTYLDQQTQQTPGPLSMEKMQPALYLRNSFAAVLFSPVALQVGDRGKFQRLTLRFRVRRPICSRGKSLCGQTLVISKIFHR